MVIIDFTVKKMLQCLFVLQKMRMHLFIILIPKVKLRRIPKPLLKKYYHLSYVTIIKKILLLVDASIINDKQLFNKIINQVSDKSNITFMFYTNGKNINPTKVIKKLKSEVQGTNICDYIWKSIWKSIWKQPLSAIKTLSDALKDITTRKKLGAAEKVV